MTETEKKNPSKLKYIENTENNKPAFMFNNTNYNNNQSIIYGNSSLIQQSNDFSTKYTRNDEKYNARPIIDFDKKFVPITTGGDYQDYLTKIDIENGLKIKEYEKKNKLENVESTDGKKFEQCTDRQRNINNASYQPSNILNYGNRHPEIETNKFNISTREQQLTIREQELDRFHFTYRNYQNDIFGSNPLPSDTRNLNKKFVTN
jgi:hypothetical protein